MKFFGVIVLLFLIHPMLTHQRADSVTYTGAVAEYNPLTNSENGTSAAKLNAENYVKFIDIANTYAVDIIVFPESSLSISTSKNDTISRSEAASYIPDPKDNIAPCDFKDRYEYSLSSISCAARKYEMYVVINHREKLDCNCDNCPSDGLLIYNTNVAFDRNGVVVARYRKYNLFGEKGTNVTLQPVLSSFKTDFNVTFGQFICFDLLFQTPTLDLIRKLGITDIVFSAHWFSELPYLFSAQAQAGWAYANDVNLLAAGYNNPMTASGGSGIYIGRKGYSHSITKKEGTNILLVSEIPKVIKGKRKKNIDPQYITNYSFSKKQISTTGTHSTKNYEYIVIDLSAYTTELIDLKSKSVRKELCDRGFCCKFKLDFTFNESIVNKKNDYYRYRLAVFNGVRTFSGVSTGGITTCGIIPCINETISGCAQLYDSSVDIVWPTVFHNMAISTAVLKKKNIFFMPMTLTNAMVSLNASNFLFNSYNDDNCTNYYVKLIKPKSHLLTFSIFGRNFAADGLEVTRSYSTSNSSLISLFLVIMTLLLTLIKIQY